VLPALFEAAKDPRGNVSVYALQSMEAYTEHIGLGYFTHRACPGAHG